MKDFKKRWTKLIILYNLTLLVVAVAFYPFIPKLLNYPPDSINNDFQLQINGMTYTQQYISILLVCMLIENMVFLSRRKIGRLLDETKNTKKKYIDVIKTVERIPKIMYLLQILTPIIIITSTFLSLKGSWEVIIRVSLVFFALFLSAATLSYVFCKGIFKDILIDIYNKTANDDVNEEVLNELKRHSIKSSVVFIILPLLVITSVLITFICYSRSTKVNGDNIYKLYIAKFNKNIFNEYETISDLENTLSLIEKNSVEDGYFILSMDREKITGDVELSDFFTLYITDIAMKNNSNRTYEFYASDFEGIFRIVNINNQPYIAGIKYATSIPNMIYIVIIVTFIILVISIILLSYVLNFVFSDITLVTEKLNYMVKSKEIDLNDRIPISSNDEISDLIKSFTLVQQKTKNYIEQIEKDQYTMQRTAQFAILGEFAGGLVHDLNSPLSAVQLDISTLRKYMNSDRLSADAETTIKINSMLDNIDSSLNRMKTITTGIRNQIRSSGDSDKEEFLLQDIIDGLKILFRSILMNNNCQLETEIPEGLTIYGEKNKLDRVIGNIIKNSIDAYFFIGKKGIIKVKAKQRTDYTIISISDKAGGIDDEIKDSLLTEIKTTKADKGTGFGLYYSNTIIESSFRGKIYFKTKDGVGTTFYIVIPTNKEEE